MGGLLGRLDPLAVRYVVKILAFELRIGLQEGLVEAAIAKTVAGSGPETLNARGEDVRPGWPGGPR
jgi:hypothetical protein